VSRVAVVGGGLAGVAAAQALLRAGEEVDLYERGGLIGVDWSLLPYLLYSGQGAPEGPSLQVPAAQELPRRPEARLLLGHSVMEVRRSGNGYLLRHSSRGAMGEAFYERVIIATGARPRQRAEQRRHLYRADVPEHVAEFVREREGFARVAVRGDSPPSLAAALGLRERGLDVLYIGARPLLRGHADAALAPLLEEACRAGGLRVLTPRLSFRVLGKGRVEAVQVDAEVVPCDCVLEFPSYLPETQPLEGLDLRLGPFGITVSEAMEAGPGLWAAGRCICLEDGTRSLYSPSFSYITGHIAGLRAAGLRLAAPSLEPVEAWRLGMLELAFAGSRPKGPPLARKFLTIRPSLGEGGVRGVALLKGGLVKRVELLGRGALAWARWCSPLISRGISYEELALCEWGHVPYESSLPLLSASLSPGRP